MRVVVAPNSFKGALSSPLAAEAIARGLNRSGLECELDLMPIADGGDDTMEVLVGRHGRVVETEVYDPLGRPITAQFGILADGRTAVVEMARASGLKLLEADERDPLKTTTYGVGQLIAEAIKTGCRRIIVGVGGSATVDGGVGCLSALGARFLDRDGRRIPPGGGGLEQVEQIDLAGLDPGLKAVAIEVACDVTNPLLGPDGAAAVFGPQKGAGPGDVARLEAGLDRLFGLAAERLGVEVRREPRTGAAGGLAAGLKAFLGARLLSGVELVLDQLGADARLARADLVITGEGRIDAQTLGGKGPMGLLDRAKRYDLPVVGLAGSVGPGEERLIEAGFSAWLPICPEPMALEEAMAAAESILEAAAARLGRLLELGRGLGRA